LGLLADPEGVPYLLKALKDRTVTVRRYAIRSLGQIKDLRAVEPILPFLHHSTSKVHREAFDALVGFGAEAVPTYIHYLQEKPDFRRCMAMILGKLGDARAVEPLIALLYEVDSSSDVYTVTNAIGSLGKIGDARAVEPLIAFLNKIDSSANAYMVAQAIVSLGEIGDLRTCDVLSVIANKPDEALPSDDRWFKPLHIRYDAALVLAEMGDVRAVDPLIAHYEFENTQWMQQKIKIALQKIDHSDARAALAWLEESTPQPI